MTDPFSERVSAAISQCPPDVPQGVVEGVRLVEGSDLILVGEEHVDFVLR